ncbi:glycoside hydrolase family 16 protein [Zalerion maritima]|uniref:Glycoside hydrolase family 16 protein n=1 Tax=Zalerion maritima TaxID=339359 RepID=A0AAD5WX99_9PEZI|nr:glycoside hydrolase family 16 protein [Zalerion maritima]
MSPRSVARRLPAIISLLVSGASFATAACECGYVSSADSGSSALFTDLLETDFLHLEDLSTNTDWAAQKFNLEKADARGKYGEKFTPDNLVTNAISDSTKFTGEGEDGGDPGLILTVSNGLEEGMVPSAEISSDRLDMFYGTYRAGMKLTDVDGTCAAFFWYFNDTQEIDMEFLSTEFNYDNDTYPVNLVLQSREAAADGYDAAGTNDFAKVDLPFNPTTDFHEYRLDFITDRVVFYADGQALATMNGSAVPTSAGHLMLSHWSNGNPLWSGGPPETDAPISVSYVKAYFNSSNTQRQSDWENRCTDINAVNATCNIPDVTADNNDAATFFFTQQENMTVNQTVSGQDSASHRSVAPLTYVIASSVLYVSGCLFGVW